MTTRGNGSPPASAHHRILLLTHQHSRFSKTAKYPNSAHHLLSIGKNLFFEMIHRSLLMNSSYITYKSCTTYIMHWTYPGLPSTKNYISNTSCPCSAQPGADERPALGSAASKIYSGNHHNTLCVEYLSENNPKSKHFVWNFHFQNHIERTVYSKKKNCCFS